MSCNQGISEQLDRRIGCTALVWRHDLSHHRAITFGRHAPQKIDSKSRHISAAAVEHEDFPRLVTLAYQDKLKDDLQASSVRKLTMLKSAMREVGLRLQQATGGFKQAVNMEDKLGTTMKCIRSVENGFMSGISVCIQRYPHLTSMVNNPYGCSGNLTVKFRRVREHAITLAREYALDELREAQDETQADSASSTAKRQKATRLLYKLAPGKSASVKAVRSRDGTFVTDPDSIARILRSHWTDTFTKRGIDGERLHE